MTCASKHKHLGLQAEESEASVYGSDPWLRIEAS
jgi:hypothetical protein